VQKCFLTYKIVIFLILLLAARLSGGGRYGKLQFGYFAQQVMHYGSFARP